MPITGAPPAAVLVYTELDGQTHYRNPGAAWVDWDLSAIVPVGTKYVDVVMLNYAMSGKLVGARENGSALNRRWMTNRMEGTEFTLGAIVTTKCGADRIIEVYASANDVAYGIAGYWM